MCAKRSCGERGLQSPRLCAEEHCSECRKSRGLKHFGDVTMPTVASPRSRSSPVAQHGITLDITTLQIHLSKSV